MTEVSISNQYHKNYYNENKNKFRDYYIKKIFAFNLKWRSGECCECGTTEKLCWHHVKPETKEFTINYMRCASKTYKEIKEELKKCVMMCKSCHMKLHKNKGLKSERKYIKDENGNIVNQSREYFRQYYLNNKDKYNKKK